MHQLNRMQITILLLVLPIVFSKPNLNIGTGGYGFGCGSNSPLAQEPFGMMRLGPDTTPPVQKFYTKFQHFGGYSDYDRYLRAFSHMHLVGAGVLDLGILGILPTRDKKPRIPKDRVIWFNKLEEEAEPGYYKTKIQGRIGVELTATLRAGLHRYNFTGQTTFYVMAGYLLKKQSQRHAECEFVGDSALKGKVFSKGSFSGRFGGLNIYFYMEWKNKPVSKGMWNDTTISESETKCSGNNTGAYLVFNENTVLYVGISYVSVDNAKENLYKQTNLQSFDTILSRTRKVWFDELSRFQITAITEKDQQKIDSAIYRTLQSPTIYSDYNGDYFSFADSPQTKKKPSNMGNIYTDMSLWDVHRSQFPWLLFQDPQRFSDIAKSIILINEQGQYMPKWPFANGPTGCMIGAHGNTVIVDWIVKQAKHFLNNSQIETIFSYMLRNANNVTKHDSRSDPTKYLEAGFLGYDYFGKSSTSQTLEYSYNDYTIAQVAKLLNKTTVYNDFLNRSTFYKNLWNNQTKFFEPRYSHNKSFVKLPPFQHTNIFSNYYVEGDAWHYRFYAPHDGQGLIELFGGKDKFVKQLDILFKRSAYWPGFLLPNPYYWAGNQHNLFSVWMFSYANRSDLTQKYSRFIVNSFYGNEGNGLPGNDDYATMSAWLIFAELGFYPLTGTQRYILGSPMIHSAKIMRKFPGGFKNFYINANNNGPNRYKATSITLDGKPLKGQLIHSDLKNNSLLIFDINGI